MSSWDGDHQIFLLALPALWLRPAESTMRNAAPAQHMDGTGEQPPLQPAAGCWERDDQQKRCCLSSWRHHTCQSKVRKNHELSVSSIPQNRLFIALNFSAATPPVLPVRVPEAGIRAGHIRPPVPRRDHSYLLRADGTLQTVRSGKAGWQVRETLALARAQQKVSRHLTSFHKD